MKGKILNYIFSSNCNGGQKYKEKPGIGKRNIFHLITWNQRVFGYSLSIRSVTFCGQALRVVKANRLKGMGSLKEQIPYPKGDPLSAANPATVPLLITFLYICTLTIYNFRGLCQTQQIQKFIQFYVFASKKVICTPTTLQMCSTERSDTTTFQVKHPSRWSV